MYWAELLYCNNTVDKLMAEARANVFHALEESAVIEGGVVPPPPFPGGFERIVTGN